MSLGDVWSKVFSSTNSFPVNSEQARRGGTFLKNIDTSHELEAAKIDAIRATQSKGFRVIDIDPNAVERDGNLGVYSDDIVSSILGDPNNGFGQNVRIDDEGPAKTGGTARPYLRTLQFEIPGTYLKVEFLPARTTTTTQPNNQALQNPVQIIPQNTDQTQNGGQFFSMGDAAGRRAVLIDFETTTPTPHLARHGQEYRTYFSSFYISFYQLNVRIRLTIGFNSEQRVVHHKEQNLETFGGHGLFTDSPIHPVPFCLTAGDVPEGPSTFSKNPKGINWFNLPIGANYYNLIFSRSTLVPGAPNTAGEGLSVFYLTGFNSSLFGSVTTTYADFNMSGIVELLICGYDTADPRTVTNIIKKVCSFDLMGNLTCQNYGGQGAASVNFNRPIRITLRPGECLALRVISKTRTLAGSTNEARLWFSLNGYMFGNLVEYTLDSDFYGMYWCSRSYTEHPFPQDVDTSFPNY